MNVLLLGSSGQLGKNFKENCPSFIKLYSYSKQDLDVTNYKLLKEVILDINPKYTINTSAYTNVDNAETNINLANEINFLAPRNMSKIISKINSFLVHFSTDYVFDGLKKTNYNELDVPNPLSVYGKSKHLGEKEVINYLKNYLIFRISWLFSNEKNNFVNKILNLSNTKKPIKVVNDQIGIPTCASELSKNIWNILIKENLETKIGLYHYCGKGDSTTWYDIAIYISKCLVQKGYNFPSILPCKTHEYVRQAIRPKNSSFDMEKMYNNFSFKQNNWKNNIKKVIDNYIKTKENK